MRSSEEYCNYYASECEVCKGERRILEDGSWYTCLCQHNASAKWRFDQIQIHPEELKYKTWNDFCGHDKSVRLKPGSFVAAKESALKYCFGKDNPSVAEERRKYLSVLEHCKDGKNCIIVGPKGSGRSLVAILILKEVVYASAIKRLNVEFRWARGNEVVDAARWSASHGETGKVINYKQLDDWCDSDFLFIDDIDLLPVAGDHRQPPDITSLNNMFNNRMVERRPTVVICTDEFWRCVNTTGKCDAVRLQWGDGFLSTLKREDNVVIQLEKEAVQRV